jgi:hypothetical protein
MNIPVEIAELSDSIRSRLCDVIRHLGLVMGVVDMKLDGDDDEPLWLEVNPQGQFLFIEGLSGLGLTEALSDFLFTQAGVAADRRRLCV